MKKASAKPAGPKRQYAALPFRRRDLVEVLLVSTRGTRRWVIPKGWPKKGCKPYVTAAREAHEEAGIVGEIGRDSIGSYSYRKGRTAGLVCLVDVFPLEVKRQRKTWPEKSERTTKWFPLALAADVVEEPGLQEVIRNFARLFVVEPPNPAMAQND